MVTDDPAAADGRPERFCRRAPPPAASTSTCGSSRDTASPATGSAAASAAPPRRSIASSRTAATIFSGPTPTHVELDPHATSLSGSRRGSRFSKIGGERDPVQLAASASSRRASTSTTSGSCAAPTRGRMGNWLQIRSDEAVAMVPRSAISTSISGPRWNFDGDRLAAAATSTPTANFTNNWSRRRRLQLQRRGTSTIGVTRRGPAGCPRTSTASGSMFSTRQPARVSFGTTALRRRRARSFLTSYEPRSRDPPGAGVRSRPACGFRYIDHIRDAQWVR